MNTRIGVCVRTIRVLCALWAIGGFVFCLVGLAYHSLEMNKWDTPIFRQKLVTTTDIEECRTMGKVALRTVDKNKIILQVKNKCQTGLLLYSGLFCFLILSVTFRLRTQDE
jgi:hypothetical protein